MANQQHSAVYATRKDNRTMNRHILRVVGQYGLKVLKRSEEPIEEVKP